eukprot:tig00020554_g10894.t1
MVAAPDPSALWNNVASVCTEFITDISSMYTRDAVKLFGDYVQRRGGASGGRVLEITAGTGALTFALARAGYSVVATDFAEEMLAHLRRGAELLPAGERERVLAVQRADAQELGPLADGSFDAVASSFGIIFVPDRAKCLRSILAAVRPGGLALVTSWTLPFEVLDLQPRALKRVIPSYEPPKPPPGAPGPLALADPAEIRAEFEAAGWTDVEVHPVSHDVAWPTRDVLFNVAKTSPALLFAARQAAGSGDPAPCLDKFIQALREVIDESYESEPIVLPQHCLVTLARRPA